MQNRVPVILCEGAPNGYDRLLLEKLLPVSCKLISCGSRFGMKHRVESIRLVCDQPCFSIIDRDFPREWQNEDTTYLHEWAVLENSTKVVYGWHWHRKEIENYLIDPEIAVKSLGDKKLDVDEYRSALCNSRDEIWEYQAARIALSVFGRSGQYYVQSSFGKKRGSGDQYKFPEKAQLDSAFCQQWIDYSFQEYSKEHSNRFASLMEHFLGYKMECMPGGDRYSNYLAAFSGKDLAWNLDSWFAEHGFLGTKDFLNSVIKGITQVDEDISDWLEEWNQLKDRVANFACILSSDVSG